MKVFRPLQLSLNHRVMEQAGRFNFIATLALGVRLSTGEALLEFDAQREAFEHMGEGVLPDLGMPKPQAEFLVCGSFHAPGNLAVAAGEVRVRVGGLTKSLYVFGPRLWQGSMPSDPEPIVTMPLDAAHAFGGKGFAGNPFGMGYQDGRLPCIEAPDRLVASPDETPAPAGFAPLDPSVAARTRYQGTYDADYVKKYYPGYPQDLDWRFFLCGPQDQWLDGYFKGDESIEICNMHPQKEVVRGQLPGLYARCFVERATDAQAAPVFSELPLNLDTVWVFPAADLVLLFWRGGFEVADDEAEEVRHILLAYESRHDTPRDADHYRQAMDLRKHSDDALLGMFKTADLCPRGAKSPMELLQERALAGALDSEFERNLDAKARSTEALVRDKVDEAMKDLGKAGDTHLDAEHQAKLAELQKLTDAGAAVTEPDADTRAFLARLEAILPGITAGDAKQLQLKEFSFDKIDEIMAEVSRFTELKQNLAMAEVEKARTTLSGQLDDLAGELDADQREQLQQSLRDLEAAPPGQPPPAPLPRVNAQRIAEQMRQIAPASTELMQHLQSMQAMGASPEETAPIEQLLAGSFQEQDEAMRRNLESAERDFKDVYITAAHFQPRGLSPHEETEDEVTARFRSRVATRESLAGGDWACLDLRGEMLDGIDLSGAYLEQVDFTGASLRGANLTGAILARAILDEADLSEAVLDEANIGAVQARRARFSGASLKSTRMSKGDFTGADFSGALLDDVETLEFIVKGCNFDGARLPAIQFIQTALDGARFTGAHLEGAMILRCHVEDVDFSDIQAKGSTWADVELKRVRFDGADLTSACFVASEDRQLQFESVVFANATLNRANFQGIAMPGTDLRNARFENANFSAADLSGANLSDAYGRQALFRKARLTGAVLDRIDLMDGSLAKAHLVSASFAGANLHAVDFLRSTHGGCDFAGANLESTLIRDWRPS